MPENFAQTAKETLFGLTASEQWRTRNRAQQFNPESMTTFTLRAKLWQGSVGLRGSEQPGQHGIE